MRAFLLAAILCLAPAAHAQDTPQPRVAGAIELADGNILIEGKDGKARLPVVGENVYEGDTITTFANSEAHLHMADGAQFIVREDSKITLFEYIADGGSEDRSLVDLAKGAMRSITGWIGQFNRTKYRIRTPLVTIGVRGTDHEPTHLLPGDPRGEPGSYDKVNEGSAFMETKQGIVEVPKNRAVFHSASGKASPRLLGSVPAFFRPGRHEQRFVARAQEVRKAIPQRRLERREFVRTRGAAGGAKAVRPAQPQKAAPVPGKPPARDAAPKMRQPDRAKPAAQALKDARTADKSRRPDIGKHPQRPGEAKKGRRPGESKN
jgi:hypothetical protein